MPKQGGTKNAVREIGRFLPAWIVERIISRLGLRLLNDSLFMYGGDCPFCGGAASFVVWVNRRTARCSRCGLDAWFGPAPEHAKDGGEARA